MRASKKTGPLAGYRVVEIATMVAGPYAGQLLSDMGADVLKVEMLTGDPMRHSLPVHHGRSAVFENFNRGKRSIAVDIRSEAGLAIVRKLVGKADVFVENARPGVMDRLGVGYDELHALNEKLVYLSINGFGSTGPLARQPTYDVAVQGLSGFMYTQGNGGPPTHIRAGVADKITGVFGALAVLGALLNNDPGGAGQRINVNMLDAYSAFMLPEVMTRFFFQDLDPEKRVNVSAGIFHNITAKDGFVTGFILQRKELEGAARAFARPDLLEDERFGAMSRLASNQDQLFAEISKVARHMPKAEIMAKVVEHQIPLAPVNDIEDFFVDPQVVHNQTYVDFADEEAGQIRTLNAFAAFEKTPADVRHLAPKLGEDTIAVLREIGLDPSEAGALRTAGVVT